MKQWRYLFRAATAACLTLLVTVAAPVSAATDSGTALPAQTTASTGSGTIQSITQSTTREIHVQATILGHRDIILDLSGRITKIISNTPEDVTPVVYMLDTIAENQRPLTDEMLAEYRKLVPVGTAKYGVLYDRQKQPRVATISSVTSAPTNPLTLTLAPSNTDTAVRELLIAVK